MTQEVFFKNGRLRMAVGGKPIADQMFSAIETIACCHVEKAAARAAKRIPAFPVDCELHRAKRLLSECLEVLETRCGTNE